MSKFVAKVSTFFTLIITSLLLKVANVQAQSAVLGAGETSQASTTSDNNTLIILGVCCLVFLLLLGAVALILFLRRNSEENKTQSAK